MNETEKSRYELFRNDLTGLLNSLSMENMSDTPDFILASYLTGCLIAYNNITNERRKWYLGDDKK